MSYQYTSNPGARLPLGATWWPEGTNFAIFSREAIGFELLLYKSQQSSQPFQTITLDPTSHQTIFVWHVFVENLPSGIHYNWQIQRFDGSRWIVLDPCARAVCDTHWDRSKPTSASNCLRGIVSNLHEVDARVSNIKKSLKGAVIYEVHVGGFTRHSSSDVPYPGTFYGFIGKIPYLKKLGITHVELMQVMAFDRQDVPEGVAQLGHENYWGYSPYGFYAPHPGYCATKDAVLEFRELVNALHEADLGVILDVVFNHTSEGGEGGPTIHFKAISSDFYHRDPFSNQGFRDYTGCGNTINCNHPLVTHFLVNCLEYWVQQLGIDGFRFDLASVFARAEDGTVLADPSLPWSIELSHIMVETPVIAEAWDAAGLYQVGSFPGARWSEWNGRYRDVMRRFVRGDKGLIGEVATCLAGSSDLYIPEHRPPTSSINFISCHDGFTLWDLVSYNDKHNLDNGEQNRDGNNNNLSWNCGVEGETTDPGILALRRQQVRNFMAILLLSQGVPMLLAGDEVLRTQNGNNNAWCQDNELSWFDWQLTETNKDMLRFVSEFIAFRRRHPSLMRNRFLTGQLDPTRNIHDICWHGRELNKPEWKNFDSQLLGFTLAGRSTEEEDIHVVLNMSTQLVEVSLPAIVRHRWYLFVDTAAPPPYDIIELSQQQPFPGTTVTVHARSVVVLEARTYM